MSLASQPPPLASELGTNKTVRTGILCPHLVLTFKQETVDPLKLFPSRSAAIGEGCRSQVGIKKGLRITLRASPTRLGMQPRAG